MDGGSGAATAYSINKLRNAASHVIDLKKSSTFDLYGAIVDHDALSHAAGFYAASRGDFL